VQVIKHVYTGHIVLQLDCTNTLNDQLLEKVSVELEIPDGWQLVGVHIVVAATLMYRCLCLVS
jgi:coatomer protein complex subunit gamma